MKTDTTQTPITDAEESNAYIHVSGLDAEDVQKAYDFSRQLERELAASKAEVARLRNELQGLKHAAQAVVDRWETPLWKYAEPTASVIYRLRDALAPAPEEPYYPEKDLPTPDEEIAYAKSTEPVPEWRELGPDEELHTGDQVQAKHHDRIHGVWLDVFPYEVGAMPIDHEAFRYRTRRLLPVQEMPLEDEIVRLQEVGRLNYAEGQQDLTDCLRYLRDEIVALKKNQK
jgi:hypothetical protein